MKKAVIYARYSSDSQTEQSIDGQLRVCHELAEKENIKIVDTYIDRAMTGTNDHRPDFQRMLHDSKKKGFDFVLVYKFDRFARSRHDSAVNKAILNRNGVKVISAIELITDTPEGIILEGMLESFAEYYSAELSQKVKRVEKKAPIPFILSGKLVCGKCKANMTGDSGTGRNGIHYYYKCHNKKKYHSCDKKSVEKNYIENYVIQTTKAFLKNCKQLKTVSVEIADLFNYTIKDDVVLNSLKSQLKDIDRQLTNMANAIANGIFSKTTNEKLNSLEQQKEDTEIKLAEHQVKRIKPLDENIVYKWLLSFADVDTADTLACKRMIDLFVNKVILYDDYFDIVFNASEDNTQNIKLENIEDYTNLENQLNNQKEQPEHNGSDCSSFGADEGGDALRKGSSGHFLAN